TVLHTLALHDALPISTPRSDRLAPPTTRLCTVQLRATDQSPQLPRPRWPRPPTGPESGATLAPATPQGHQSSSPPPPRLKAAPAGCARQTLREVHDRASSQVNSTTNTTRVGLYGEFLSLFYPNTPILTSN